MLHFEYEVTTDIIKSVAQWQDAMRVKITKLQKKCRREILFFRNRLEAELLVTLDSQTLTLDSKVSYMQQYPFYTLVRGTYRTTYEASPSLSLRQLEQKCENEARRRLYFNERSLDHF